MLDELIRNGMNLSRFAERVNLSDSTLHNANHRGVLYGEPTKLAGLLRHIAKLLSRANLRDQSIDYICKETLIKEAHVAERLGISKQALNKNKTNFSALRQERIAIEFRFLGQVFEEISKRLDEVNKQ